MTWLASRSWDQPFVERIRALDDLDHGTVLVPAGPRALTARAGLMSVLTAMGKGGTIYGQPSELSTTLATTVAWLRGESVHTVILLSAQRWRLEPLEAVAAAAETSGVQLVAVTTGPMRPAVERWLRDRYGSASCDLELLRRRPLMAIPAPSDPWRRLRRCRLPYAAAVTAALATDATTEELAALTVDDVDPTGDLLVLPGRVAHLPPGCGRFLRAQRELSALYGLQQLFGRFGTAMTGAELAYAGLVAAREADVLPGDAAPRGLVSAGEAAS